MRKNSTYKHMKQTRIQMYDEKNTYKRTKKNPHTNICNKQGYKCMTKNMHIRGGRWRSGISRRPKYRGYSPRYSGPRFESLTGWPLLCVIPTLSLTCFLSLYCPVIKGMKKPQKIIILTHTNV